MTREGTSKRDATTPAWPSFLRGESASQLYQRMLDSDPLRLREACARRLREAWFLLEPERTFRRAAAVCADAARCDSPPLDLALWAREKIDLAIGQLVRDDAHAEHDRPDEQTEEERDFALLTECFQLEAGLVRATCVAFNALDPLPRRAFFELLIEGKDLAEVLEGGPWDEDGLYLAVHTALATMNLDLLGEHSTRRKGAPPR